jgi:hypothetical protein
LGIDTGNYKPLALTEDQQIRNYMSKNFGDGSDIGNENDNSLGITKIDEDKDSLNHAQ